MTEATRYAEAWAANAVTEIATLGDQALSEWIVTHRYKLGDCIKHAPASHVLVKAALAERDTELRHARIRQGVG